MRDNTTMKYVRSITTGHIEADMLGQTLNIAEEIRGKQNTPQRPHRNGMIKRKLKKVLKWFQTAPTACWRRLKAWENKKLESVPKYLQGVRKDKLNGK